MEIRRLSWLGIRTEKLDELARLFEETLGLKKGIEQPGRVMFELPNGDPIDIFSADDPRYGHFTTGPVVGFLVDDVEVARDELITAGVEEVGRLMRGDGFVWAHFRGPDGNLYELQAREPNDA
jgi:catechol 2,3-dioxygenase-like lactoylglutathione lyase family enzyme